MKKKNHQKRSVKFKSIRRDQAGNARTGFRKPRFKWDAESAIEREKRLSS